ncbi:MAG TPA: methyltransferase [Actinophytocola sp.]|uniref:methyltransferase n=1 Tax=Actinophytocola sp. TaxID=1872138 RepID=UPI002DBC7B1A|nr:methyltransferase [Actinophytocola sp.]HEU5469116.1 methyltransferase [Actinophytocola sp.]
MTVDGFARRKLLGILSGGVPAQCCYALAKLGVADLLADGPRTVAELATDCGANPRVLRRLLRGMASLGLFRRMESDTYELTPVGEPLCTAVAGSLRQTAVMHGEEVHRSFGEIMHTVRTGEPAFDQVHGRPFYAYLAEHPDAAGVFAGAMGSERVPATLAGCDLTGVTTLVDVGGGSGGLLAEALRSHPGMRGVLLELADAVRAARARLCESGVADRVDLVEGSFFDQVPHGGDAYVLSRVLHNWADEHATVILRRVRAAMDPGARLLVFEKFLSDNGGSAASAMVDLLMLGMLEGHDRTQAEYRELLTGAGFDVVIVRPSTTDSAESVIEAVPA